MGSSRGKRGMPRLDWSGTASAGLEAAARKSLFQLTNINGTESQSYTLQ